MLLRMGVVQKGPPYQFFPCNFFLNRELACKIFLLLVLTLLPHWCNILRPYIVSIPSYRTRTKSIPQKIWFFWSNPCKIEVMITSLIEILELPNFDHVTISTILYEHHHIIFLLTSWIEIMTSKTLF